MLSRDDLLLDDIAADMDAGVSASASAARLGISASTVYARRGRIRVERSEGSLPPAPPRPAASDPARDGELVEALWSAIWDWRDIEDPEIRLRAVRHVVTARDLIRVLTPEGAGPSGAPEPIRLPDGAASEADEILRGLGLRDLASGGAAPDDGSHPPRPQAAASGPRGG